MAFDEMTFCYCALIERWCRARCFCIFRSELAAILGERPFGSRASRDDKRDNTRNQTHANTFVWSLQHTLLSLFSFASRSVDLNLDLPIRVRRFLLVLLLLSLVNSLGRRVPCSRP